MKALLPLLIFLLAFPLLRGAQPSTPEDFIAAYRTAINEKSAGKINALTYSVGMSEEDKKQVASHLETIFNDKEIAAITLEPLPVAYKPFVIMNGKKLEPTFPPAGVIKIQYATVNGTSSTSSRPYAIVDGHYFLVPNKATNVPVQLYSLRSGTDSPDKEFHFAVEKEGEPGQEILVYGIVSSSTGKTFYTIPCVYQLNEGDDSWPLKNAQSAEVYWSPDGAHFVLDEENYRLMGYAILGTISEDHHRITTHAFAPSDLRMTGLAKWRIRVDKGWITPTTLSLEISGTYDATGAVPNANFTQNFSCEIDDATYYRFVKTK